MKTKKFHLGDILTITTGRLVSPRHIDGVYDILNFMTGDNLYTHQLGRASEECKPYLLAEMPWLDNPEIHFSVAELSEMLKPASGSKEESQLIVNEWLSKLVSKYGKMHEVRPIHHEDHEVIDPLVELKQMAPGKEIIMFGGDEQDIQEEDRED